MRFSLTRRDVSSLGMLDRRAHANRNLRFRPPENVLLAHKADFDFLHEFSGRFSTRKGPLNGQ